MQLHERVLAIDSIAVEGDVEDRAHVFRRVIFSLPRSYVVEETPWSADTPLGELRWWQLLSAYGYSTPVLNAESIPGSDVQIMGDNIENVERKGANVKVSSGGKVARGSISGPPDVVPGASNALCNDRGALWCISTCSGPTNLSATWRA